MSTESDKYDVLEKIGHGSFGVIRKVRRKADGLVMCRKEISYLKMSQKEREQLHAEFQILSQLKHTNIVGYYHREHLKATQDLHLYMEYCGNGDLGRVIKDLAQKGQRAQESFVWSIFSQLVTALYRCHYGIDPPEVGSNVLGLFTSAVKPKTPAGTMTILHRDLKPENVFLGEDNSVKLGDFGLSKMIQSHDFASTYVGTPFYMSPEICAAEKYTLKSDIWSLGCIIYELCTREPPFNAKTHLQLVQKIREGKFDSLPDIYSPELNQVIKDCLRVNPDRRPDTSQLLNLPVVRLMRKEKEVVDFQKELKTREAVLTRRDKEIQQKLAAVEADKTSARQEIDASLRREWEVKARLEIDRLVNTELEQLQRRFENEVQARVDVELAKKTVTFAENVMEEQHFFSSSSSKSDFPHSSVGATSTDGDFPSTTDFTELSIDSPDVATAPLKKSAKTPFARAQTMFAGGLPGTPMDIEMASPSPAAIASLSLSPRRNAGTKAPSANTGDIFGANANDRPNWSLPRESPVLESDDEEVFPSPTRATSTRNPFTSKTRPVLSSQKSAPLRAKAQAAAANKALPSLPTAQSNPDLAGHSAKDRCPSPNRRLSKIPSALGLAPEMATASTTPGTASGLARKSSVSKKDPPEPAAATAAAAGLGKLAAKNNIKGRTLVELQQARAGGRPMSALAPLAGGENASPKRGAGAAFKDRVAGAAAGERPGSGSGGEPAAIWDPERDEMPSPFLSRRKAALRV